MTKALLFVVNSPFQARFAGLYTVAKCMSNNNYLLNTPDRRKKVQVCHVNLLKHYFLSTLPVTSSSTPLIP